MSGVPAQSEPRTTKPRVRVALGETPDIDIDVSAVADEVLDICIEDAHGTVERRCVPYVQVSNKATRESLEQALEVTERYVAASNALPSITGSATGSQVESKSAADVRIDYDTDAGSVESATGVVDAHWKRALREDPSGRLGKRVKRPYFERRR